jgi:adenylate cyclase
MAVAATAALVLILGGWWLWTKPSAKPAIAAAKSISQPLVAPHSSIVVLPFANLGNDPDQQYFSDGITEDLTTDLSRLVGVFF